MSRSYRAKQARKANLQIAGVIAGFIIVLPVVMLLAVCLGADLANDTTVVPAIFHFLGAL